MRLHERQTSLRYTEMSLRSAELPSQADEIALHDTEMRRCLAKN